MAYLNSPSEVSNEVVSAESSDEPSILEQLTKSGMQSLMELIKASNNLPIDQWDFFKTFPSFNGLIMPESQRILEILKKILKGENVHGSVTRRDDDEKYEMVIEANDAILERVDCNLDELQGLKKNPEPVVGEIRAIRRRGMFSLNNRESANQTRIVHSLVTTRLNSRPQIKFKDKVDNRSIPFEPRIMEKPNALKPLAILLEKYDDRGESFSHPYEYELDLFKPPEYQLKICEPLKPKPLTQVPLLFVNTLDSLKEMMEHLKTSREIAVDVEHHSYRSFQGFTCLVQISSRERDYIVDALELRHQLFALNEVFTDPKIVKVFHGADHDIEWLQRDLSVYVVNMFDTHQAAQLLDFPRLSLAHLLKVFCNVDCNKQFQLFDWRTRPLPEEAVRYAREDTHYLLYIYDRLKNSLIEKCNNKSNLLEIVFNRSTEICKRKYWKDILTENSHMEFYRKSKKMFDNRQMYALKQIYQWRDKVAREEDESIMYVLPNHMLLNIAEGLPREVQGISALCNPVPPLVKLYERDIHKIILKAREQSLVKPIVEGESFNQSFEMQPNWVPVNIDSKLYCPHDFSRSDDDFRENLPTMLQRNLKPLSSIDVKKNKFCVNVSAAIDVLCDECENDNPEWNASLLKGKERQWKFVSPYQRYQKVLAFVHAEDAGEGSSELQNEITDVDGPSNSKIARLDDSKTSNPAFEKVGIDEDVSESNQNAETGVDSLVHLQSAVNSVDSTQPASSTRIITNDHDGRKKKKKKLKDVKNLESSSSKKELIKDNELQPVDACRDSDSGSATVKINEIVIPNLIQQGEVTEQDHSSSVKQNKKLTAGNKNGKKKKMDNNDDGAIDKKRVKNKDDFQPFNYNEVDFSRFQSTTTKQNPKKTSDSNRKAQGRRTPWLGNKKALGNLSKL